MKVAFVSLGCAKNLVNTEQMMALCRAAGYTVTGEPEGADVAVVNTCGFIDSAKSEAIDTILSIAPLKSAGKPPPRRPDVPARVLRCCSTPPDGSLPENLWKFARRIPRRGFECRTFGAGRPRPERPDTSRGCV